MAGARGLSSENAAHRIAVEWDVAGETNEEVYIPRRDTNSRVNTFLGGRFFPGLHHYASFGCAETEDTFHISVRSDDGLGQLQLKAVRGTQLSHTSVFRTLEEASALFERGSHGYSATADPTRFDGLELHSLAWHVEPLDVILAQSSFFDDHAHFPAGSIAFESALLMRQIPHRWHRLPELC